MVEATDVPDQFKVTATTTEDLSALNARDLNLIYTQADGTTTGEEIALGVFAADGTTGKFSVLVTLAPGTNDTKIALYEDKDDDGYQSGDIVFDPITTPTHVARDNVIETDSSPVSGLLRARFMRLLPESGVATFKAIAGSCEGWYERRLRPRAPEISLV